MKKKSLAICELTKQKFEYEPILFNGKEMFKPRFCPAAICQMQDEEANRVRREQVLWRQQQFAVKCPRLFQETDVKRLPAGPWKIISAWDAGKSENKGLLLIGETGAGKTRCIWKLLERQWLEVGNSFIFLTEIEFALEAVESLMNSKALWFLNGLRATDILVLDDLGKAKHTDRTREALFAVIDQRMTDKLPTFYTTQFTGEELKQRFLKGEAANQESISAESADALLRRIRETSTVIEFPTKGKKI